MGHGRKVVSHEWRHQQGSYWWEREAYCLREVYVATFHDRILWTTPQTNTTLSKPQIAFCLCRLGTF